MQTRALALALLKSSPTWIWLLRLGGPGLVLLGLADNSVIPLPGSMDVLTIWLAARHHPLWPYYAFMATLGSIIGGYVTYHLARKGGKETLERRMSKRTTIKVYKKFEKWGFWSVAISALIPPPFPIVPTLLTAGAMQYSRRKFVGALALGRGVRFTIVAFLGAHYGRHVLRFFSQYYKPALFTLISFSLIAGGFAFYQYRKFRKNNPESSKRSRSSVPRVPRRKTA
jgi:membrane protein YqaA with SNARE-associated domain